VSIVNQDNSEYEEQEEDEDSEPEPIQQPTKKLGSSSRHSSKISNRKESKFKIKDIDIVIP